MKILMLIDALNIGVTETHVIELCKSLHNVSIKAKFLFIKNTSSFFNKQKFCFKCIESNNTSYSLDSFIDFIKYKNIDTIHSHGIESIKFIRNFYNT